MHVAMRLYVLVAEVRRLDLDAVRDAFRACHARAVGAAVKRAVRLDAVPYHLDAATLAVGREGMYRALEAVEGVRVSTGDGHLKGFIVLISTDFAPGHLAPALPERDESPISAVTTLTSVESNARLTHTRSFPSLP